MNIRELVGIGCLLEAGLLNGDAGNIEDASHKCINQRVEIGRVCVK